MFGCLPIMPNYSLGPILGSHCDSLNLNNTVDFDQNNFRVTQYRNEIIIESDMNYQGLSYRLVDLNGNIILNRLFDPLRIQNIALENIPNGIYFLSIQKNSNVIKIEKIVVVRN